MNKPINLRIMEGDLLHELHFHTSLSSGPGGQTTNKVQSKVQLLFDIQNSIYLTTDEKLMLYKKLPKKINQEGMLFLSAQERRSQLENREIVIKKFNDLLMKTFEPKKTRKATGRTKDSIEERLTDKHAIGEKKANRHWETGVENIEDL